MQTMQQLQQVPIGTPVSTNVISSSPSPSLSLSPPQSFTTTNTTLTNIPSTTTTSPEFVQIVSPTAQPTVLPTYLTPQLTSPYTVPLVSGPATVVTSTIPIDCKRESDEYWDCFEPSFTEGKGQVCRPDCMRECTIWLGHSRGILAECQEAMHEVLRIYPADVSMTGLTGFSSTHPSSGPASELLETEGILPNSTSSPQFLYASQSFPSATKTAFLEVRIPYLHLAIETPGYYLLPDGQHRLRYYISHFITPVRFNDETRWKIQPTTGDDGRPLTGISSGTLEEGKATLLDLNGAAEAICNIMGTSNLKSLIINLEVPLSTLHSTFSSEQQIQQWWNLFRDRVRVFKGRTAWFPPASTGGYGDIADEFLFFQGDKRNGPRPFRWSLRLSLRHLLLFYLIRTRPEGTELTRLEKRNVTYSLLPKKVRSYFQDWYYSHG